MKQQQKQNMVSHVNHGQHCERRLQIDRQRQT
jgi:hypothetical protein